LSLCTGERKEHAFITKIILHAGSYAHGLFGCKKRLVSEKTVEPCPWVSETLKFGTKQVSKGSHFHREEIEKKLKILALALCLSSR